MKKTLIAATILGASFGIAHAQSNILIYGNLDTGYIKESGRDLRMGANVDNRIGFRGFEDLGGGLKALFEMERRFDANDGSISGTSTTQYRGKNGTQGKDWEAGTAIGLMGNFGKVRIGYIPEISTQTIRAFDPFEQNGIGSMIWSSQRSEGIENALRFDSPTWAGFNFSLSYTLGKNTKKNGDLANGGKDTYGKAVDNDGYGINLSYDNYGFLATANWSRFADSNHSSVWNLGVGYRFGPARVTLLYEKTKEEGVGNQPAYRLAYRDGTGAWTDDIRPDNTNRIKNKQELLLLGLEWDIGPGQLDASIQRGQLKDVKAMAGGAIYTNSQGELGADKVGAKRFKDRDIMKYAIGYTYNLSKRTSIYGQIAYTDYDEKDAGRYYTGMNRDSVTGVQVGMTHRF